MAATTTPNLPAAIPDANVSKELGILAAQVGARYLEQYAFNKEELENGRTAFQKLVLSNYNLVYSNTYTVAPAGQVEQTINKLASALRWSTEFAVQVKGLAQLDSVAHDEIVVKFCTDTSGGCFALRVIATLRDQNGNQHIKVVFAKNDFTFAPNVERITLEDKEPIFVMKTSFWRSSKRVQDGFKTIQRVQDRVTPQTINAGDAEKMHRYLMFKMSQAVCNMCPGGLTELSTEAKSMLTW